MKSREIKHRQGIGRRGKPISFGYIIKSLPRFTIPAISSGKRRASAIHVKELFFRLCVIATIILTLMIVWRVIRPGVNVRVNPEVVAAFRVPHQAIGMLIDYADKYSIPFPELFTVFNVENNFFPEKSTTFDLRNIEKTYVTNFPRLWNRYNSRSLEPYVEMFRNLFNEIETFPIPSGWYNHDASVMFGNSWGVEHNFQGKRMHMGTAIIDRENIRGRIPVVSMTAGQVANAGWDNQLGYFVGVVTQSGSYYLYAHLDSIAAGIEAGKNIPAGQPLGQMGNSGGGRNSRSFHVHLHLAISPNVSFTRGQFWINPYPLLRYLENRPNL